MSDCGASGTPCAKICLRHLKATPFTHPGDDIRDGPVLSNGGAAMAWMFLLVAGLLEIIWALAMKLSQSFTRGAFTAVTAVTMLASVALLSMAMKTIPLGTAYAV